MKREMTIAEVAGMGGKPKKRIGSACAPTGYSKPWGVGAGHHCFGIGKSCRLVNVNATGIADRTGLASRVAGLNFHFFTERIASSVSDGISRITLTASISPDSP